MENTLLTTNIKTIIANKWYIPISAWDSLPKSAKESIKSLYIQKTNNPYNCFIHTTNKKCQLKEAMVESGRKPIVACFNCSKSEDKVSCISKSGKYIKLEIGSSEAGNKVLGIFKQHGIILDFDDRRVFPRIENKWEMDYNKLDEEKSREQRRLADLWIAEKKGILIAPPRFGKCCVGSTLIPTNKGILPIENLCENPKKKVTPIDLTIANRDNQEEKASHFFTDTTNKTIYVRTNYGHEIQGTPEHPIVCLDSEFNIVWKKLSEIKKGDIVCISSGQDLWSNTNYKFQKNRFSEYMTPEIARMVGYLIANGGLSIGTMYFTSKNIDIVNDIKNILKSFNFSLKHYKSRDWEYVLPKEFRIFMRDIVGLKLCGSHFKEFPISILSSSKEIITECLSAYFSCDSYIHNSYIELCTASRNLSYQLQVILNNYGITSKRISYKVKVGKDAKERKERYFSIYINGKDYKLFREIFKLMKKCHSDTKDYDKSWYYPIPGLQEYLNKLQDSYPRNSGWYEINGKKIQPKLFNDHKFTINKKSFLSKNSLNKFESGWDLLEDGLCDRLKNLQKEHFNYFPVTFVKEVNTPVQVYDLVVPKTHSFSSGCFISHNTILCANIACKAKTRVLLLVHKVDLANQFYKDWTEFTTISKNRIKVNPKIEEMENLDVCLCTYQQFVGKYGEERLEKAKKLFGLIIVDEVHKASADKFHDVINSFWAKYRLAVTATPERRDNKQFRNEHTFGPILAQGGTEQLSCNYVYTETNWTIPYKMSGDRAWTLLWAKLAKDEERNELISKYVIKDVLANHKIMIPVKRHDHIKLLHDMINKLAKKEGILISVCEYHGNLNKQVRNKLQEDIYQGKYDVVIGMDSIISLGFNAPPMSAIYINVHTYRTFAPDLYQEFSRVRTKPKKGKKNKPLIRIFKDIGEQSDKSIAMISKEMVKYGFSELADDFVDRNILEKSKKGLIKFM